MLSWNYIRNNHEQAAMYSVSTLVGGKNTDYSIYSNNEQNVMEQVKNISFCNNEKSYSHIILSFMALYS